MACPRVTHYTFSVNPGESHGELMSLELEYVSLAAGFRSLLPWLTQGMSFAVHALEAPPATKEAAGSELQEREFARAALQVSERLLRQFFDDSPISLAVLDPAGRLLHFNRAFGVMLGYAAEDLRERNIEELVHPDDVPAIQERRRMLIEGRSDGFQLETRFATANRRELWTRMSGRIERAPAGRPPHIFAHIVELTELRHAEENFRRAAADGRVKNWDPERYM